MVTIYSATYYFNIINATKGFAWQFILSGSQVRAWWIHESPQSCCILCTIYFIHCKCQAFPSPQNSWYLISFLFPAYLSGHKHIGALFVKLQNRWNVSHSVLTTNSCDLLSSSDSDSPARAVGRSSLCDTEFSCLPLNARCVIPYQLTSCLLIPRSR